MKGSRKAADFRANDLTWTLLGVIMGLGVIVGLAGHYFGLSLG